PLPPPAPLPVNKVLIEITPPTEMEQFPPPRPKPVKERRETLHLKDRIEAAWLAVRAGVKERDNVKLTRAMRTAFELGVLTQYNELRRYGPNEFRVLVQAYPNASEVAKASESCALIWANREVKQNSLKLFPPDVSRRKR